MNQTQAALVMERWCHGKMVTKNRGVSVLQSLLALQVNLALPEEGGHDPDAAKTKVIGHKPAATLQGQSGNNSVKSFYPQCYVMQLAANHILLFAFHLTIAMACV